MIELEFIVEGSRWEVIVDRPGAWTMGRRRADCAIQVPHSSISRVHATLLVTPQAVEIENHSGTTGLMVNRRAVDVGQRTPVKPDDLIQFGSVGSMLLRRGSYAPAQDEFEFRLGGWKVRLPYPYRGHSVFPPYVQEHADRIDLGFDLGPPGAPGLAYGQQRTTFAWERGWESLEQLLEVQQQHWSRLPAQSQNGEIVHCTDYSWGHVVRINTAAAGYAPGNSSDYLVLRRCREIDVFYLNPSMFLNFDWTRLRAWRLTT